VANCSHPPLDVFHAERGHRTDRLTLVALFASRFKCIASNEVRVTTHNRPMLGCVELRVSKLVEREITTVPWMVLTRFNSSVAMGAGLRVISSSLTDAILSPSSAATQA